MTEARQSGSRFAVATMFALFFVIAFVTNFGGSMGVVVKNQFGASNTASQLGSAANFFAYLFMGIPGGLILGRRGYKFTILLATFVGFVGVGIQLISGFLCSFPVYVTGAFVAGFAMCLLNLVVNPLLNTLGGGGNGGNRLVQFGSSFNSVGGTLAPVLLGYLIGGEVSAAKVADVTPVMMIAMAIFVLAFAVVAFSRIPEPHLETTEERQTRRTAGSSVWNDVLRTLGCRHFTLGAVAMFLYIVIEFGIPSTALLYMTESGKPWYVGAAVAGSVGGAYCLFMMFGRVLGGCIGSKVSARHMVAVCAAVAIGLLLAIMCLPLQMVEIAGTRLPVSMVLVAVCGLCTSVMWGGIFNLATEGLGRYVPIGSGIFMTMCVGGILLPMQGWVADGVGILNSYWFTVVLLAYVLYYAVAGSRVSRRGGE